MPYERSAELARCVAASRSWSAAAICGTTVEQALGEWPAELVGLGDGQHAHAGVLGEPALGGVGGGEEVDVVAERGAHGRRVVGGDDRHHRSGGVKIAHAGGVDGEPDRDSGRVAGGFDAGGGVEDGGEDQGVQGTPGVEPPAGDLELVRGGSLGQAAADDTAVLVVFGVGHGRQRLPNIIDPAAGGGGELVDSDGLAGGQQGEQRLPQPGLAAGGIAAVERGGQAGGELFGGGVHDRVPSRQD